MPRNRERVPHRTREGSLILRIRLAMVGLLIAMLASTLLPSGARAASLMSFTTTTPTTYGGKTVSATVRLDTVAPAGGHVITLQSSNTAVATVPASVTIREGRASTTVSVKTLGVASATAVSISASLGGTTKSVSFTVNAAAMGSLSLPRAFAGGAAVRGTVNLYGVAPAGGITVSLYATGIADVPATVQVQPGRASATFAISTTPVTSTTTATVSATYNGVTKSGTLTVNPPALASLGFSPATIGDGVTSRGTVKLNGPAPTGGARVTLSVPSNSPVSIPSAVTIPAGSLSATFSVTGETVTTLTSVSVTATYGVTKTTTLKVSPATLASLRWSTTRVEHNGTATGTITLTTAAPAGGVVVTLSSNSAAWSVPATVTIPAGATTATFVGTAQSPAVRTSARTTASYGSISKTASVTVNAAPVAMVELVALPNPTGSLSPTGIGIGLSGPAQTGGFPVTITSSNPTLVPITGSYTILAGQDTLAVVRVTGSTTTAQTVRITVAGGGKTMFVDILVEPYAVYDLTAPTSIVGGNTSTGTVELAGLAPAGGAIVSLSSSNSAVSVPATVTVPAGQMSANFTITTSGQTSSVPVVLTASAFSSEVTANVTVNPLQVAGWGTFPVSMPNGTTANAVISMNGVPGPGGAVIQLTSSNPSAAGVPASITVTSGTSGIFQITSGEVASPTVVTISATLGGKTVTKTLTVTPPALTGIGIDSSLLLNMTHSGTVALDGPAPAGGVVVSLVSSSAKAVVPATVTIAAGSTTASFSITTGAVTTPVNFTITATAGGVSKTVNSQVIPIGPFQGRLSTAALACGTAQGDSRTYSFSLSGPAPAGGLLVAITTGTPALHAPAEVLVPAGATGFEVPACGDLQVSQIYTYLRATANGLSAEYSLGLMTGGPNLSVSSLSVTGGSSMTVTLSMDYDWPAGATGMTWPITSSNPAVVPNFSISLTQGQSSVTVTITPNVVSAPATVTLTANGYRDDSITFTVVPVSVADVIEEPVSTPEPVVTEEPVATEEPVVVETPVVTEVPAEPTAEVTVEATATPEPVATEEPEGTPDA